MKIEKSIEIAAPPERIWPFFIDPEKVLRWSITFIKFQYAGDQQSGIGTPLYIEEKASGPLMKMNFEVTEWKENERLQVLRSSHMSRYGHYRQLNQVASLPSMKRSFFLLVLSVD